MDGKKERFKYITRQSNNPPGDKDLGSSTGNQVAAGSCSGGKLVMSRLAQTQVKMVKVMADNWSKVESSPAQSSAKAKMGTPVALLLSTDDRCIIF